MKSLAAILLLVTLEIVAASTPVHASGVAYYIDNRLDLEWSESRVGLHANLFAFNAGAGVEILSIHRGDHIDDIDFSDNTFTNNSRSLRPGAASIWENSKGS